MAARPRLVQEGSPIVNDSVDATNFTPAVADIWPTQHATNSSSKSRNKNHSRNTSSCPRKSEASVSNSFKLQTRLIVGGGVSTLDATRGTENDVQDDDLSVGSIDHDMMMDEDDNLHDSVAHPTLHSSKNPNNQYRSHGTHHVQQNQQQHWQQQHYHATIHNQFEGPHTEQVLENNQAPFCRQSQDRIPEYNFHNHCQHLAQNNPQFRTSSNNFDVHTHQLTQNNLAPFHSQSQMRAPENMFQDHEHSAQTNSQLSTKASTPAFARHMPPPNKSPLIVIDGANVAYHYAECLNPFYDPKHRPEPNPRGITLAVRYFLQHNCRVQAIIPISWYRQKPRATDTASARGKHGEDAKMVTDEVDELRTLREQGFLVACPPGDDDDSYALGLARREEDRLMDRLQHLKGEDLDDAMNLEEVGASFPIEFMSGYVLSNDFFQDAIRREQKNRSESKKLSYYSENSGRSSLSHHYHPSSSLQSWLKQHRISYSFADIGSTSDGERELEFLPNPRHPLVETIENIRHNLLCRAKQDTVKH
mmetsp:Transcript_23178/g.48498  ORF Transcript_23178/g.48498 Transcript_23178/m.48498 type:complete len:532 (-) Transcript_23178:141-1736(-)